MYRAHHIFGKKNITCSSGDPVHVVYGTYVMTCKLIRDSKKDGSKVFPIVCFDAKTCNNYRRTFYPQYKHTRTGCPTDITNQRESVRDMFECMGIRSIQVENYEADDIIASFATQYGEHYDKVVIVSPDKDLNQLVGGNVTILNTKHEIVDTDAVFKKHNVRPQDFVMYQSLMGDSIDNIPGVPGIGPKTASAIVSACGGDMTKLGECDHIKKELVKTHIEQIWKSKKLVELVKDIVIDSNAVQFEWNLVNTQKLHIKYNISKKNHC